jgi:UDP-N-acetylglucosamine 2-epimerase (non-hydrolysing)
VGTDEKIIYWTLNTLLEDKEEYQKMSNASNPSGMGQLGQQVNE